MIVEQTVTWLEMTSPDELRPGRLPPAPVELEPVDRPRVPLLRATNDRVGEPHGWTGRSAWSEARWVEHLAKPGVRAFVARVGGEPAGLVELEARPGGEVEITVFGLVPEFVGRGFGGHLLTRAVRLAWDAGHPEGDAHPAGVAAHRLHRPRARPPELPGSGAPRRPQRGPAQAGPGQGRLTWSLSGRSGSGTGPGGGPASRPSRGGRAGRRWRRSGWARRPGTP